MNNKGNHGSIDPGIGQSIGAERSVPGLPRNTLGDLLKGLAVLLMIQVHIMENFGSAELYGSFIGKISLFLGGPPCAPVFMAVMGYFLAGKSRPWPSVLKRGAVLFISGILLNAARSMHLFIHIGDGSLTLDPWFYVLGADILTLAGLSVVITGLLLKIPGRSPWLFLLLAPAIAWVSPVISAPGDPESFSAYLRAFFTGYAEWSYFPLFPWLAYVLAGIGFRLMLEKYPAIKQFADDPRILLLVVPVIGVLAYTFPWALSVSHHLEGAGGYYHHGIAFFGWVAAFMILWLLFVRHLDMNSGKARGIKLIRMIGVNVTLIYVIQWLIIGNLTTAWFRSQGLLGFLAWFAGILTLSVLLTFLVEWIRKAISSSGGAGATPSKSR